MIAKPVDGSGSAQLGVPASTPSASRREIAQVAAALAENLRDPQMQRLVTEKYARFAGVLAG